jgi:hypothetical protein
MQPAAVSSEPPVDDPGRSVRAKVAAFLTKRNDAYMVSYLGLRQLIGWLGAALPFVVVIGGAVFSGAAVKESVSAYYHSCMRDFFVGLLAVVGLFMITYKGFDRADNLASSLAGIAALGVALFPNDPGDSIARLGIFQLSPTVSDRIHTACAAVHFVTLACISLFLFTKTDKSKTMTPKKVKRNKLYRTCGIVMFAALGLIVACTFGMSDTQRAVWRPTLFGETVALLAFGVSWIVKGEWILKDG